ncbi:hypothetical protein HPG69_005767 [Diceros bicornis minor]|uniref:Uncharacterized protein n=1 Tax=Diceros bicornis minor TaxID=77932 RepID=A0A7J7EST4_DICBM|nr:hypothetical protein HPG69_005767 [Diceros bicornis minor]
MKTSFLFLCIAVVFLDVNGILERSKTLTLKKPKTNEQINKEECSNLSFRSNRESPMDMMLKPVNAFWNIVIPVDKRK